MMPLPALISTRSGLFFEQQATKEQRQRTMANLVIIGSQWGDEGKGKSSTSLPRMPIWLCGTRGLQCRPYRHQ